MPFKPFAHLARVTLAKGLAHSYAPSVAAAGQSSYATTTTSLGQFQSYPVQKFAKTTHLQHAFTGSSSSSGAGAGAKAGHASGNSNVDAGLAQYYAAWQHAQQTGDDSDWKQQQIARRIGWKSLDKSANFRPAHRLDSARAVDLLRPSARLQTTRAYSESAAQDTKNAEDSFTEAEALARIDEAIAQEIRDGKESKAAVADTSGHDQTTSSLELSSHSATEPSQASASAIDDVESVPSSYEQTTSPEHISLTAENSAVLSRRIVELGEQKNHVEIPIIFELMLKDGLTPTVDAYNHILVSAIKLGTGSYQVWPGALEVYSDMTRRAVEPDAATYTVLIKFLTARGTEAYHMQQSLAQRQVRFGNADGSFMLKSTDLLNELYAGDNSIVFATKLYNVARAKLVDFALPTETYNALLHVCMQDGRVEDMKTILYDMKASQVPVDLELFVPMINSYASIRDISAAQSCYEEYRDLAIIRASNEALDMTVYGALVKAYYDCGLEDAGLHFYKKVLQSFEGARDEQSLADDLTASLVIKALIPHNLKNGKLEEALEVASAYGLTVANRDLAMSKICVAASDADNIGIAQSAFSAITATSTNAEPASALMAMFVRQGRVADAKSLVDQLMRSARFSSNEVDFTAMYTTAMLRNGMVEEGLLQARRMFEQIRTPKMTPNMRSALMDDIDEAIVLFGETLTQQHAIISPQVSINLLRTMIENGGLVSPVAQHAIASLGPDCIHQLNSQDIALALHVQAGMVPNWTEVSDPAHAARFSHLLETVLNRSIPMDPSTVHIVGEALPRLQGTRPDLVERWHNLLHPTPKVQPALQIFSPVLPPSPVVEMSPTTDSYDPYAYNSDFRASKIIEDQLESTTGRTENHLSDALSRFRNVRRAGRHVHYRAYAKLITAAGKTKQTNLIHEIMGMAQADVPFMQQYPSVKAGWVGIYDAVVSAYLTVGNRQLAGKFHQDLLNMGAAPSANTFGIYITTLEGTFDEATEAVKIFQRALSEGVEPSVFLYNAVIGKLGKARRIDDCLFYFGDMQAKNIRPSSVTYGTLVNALCRTSEERFAEEMFDEMESMPNYRPRAAPYNSIIQYFLNTKRDRSKVLAYYERMKSRNIKPTSHTYKLLIEAHASLDPVNLSAAEAVLQEMKASGIQPESVHYGSLIHAKGCVMHDMASARAAFDSVLADGLVRPTDNLYQNLLESMVANHQVAQTSEVLEDMAARRVSMTPYIANTLIHGWAGEKNIIKAKSIYDALGIEKREPSTYEAMTRAFLSVEDHTSANEVVQEMLRKGYPSAVAEKVLVLVGGAAA